MQDWNPREYARFRSLRLRPALDLLERVGAVPPGDVVDLGCGDGAAAESLAARFPGRHLVGVDASAAMLAQARSYSTTVEADITAWVPARAPAIIFSNAALHWLPSHAEVIPRLARCLAPGGVLAVQMPRQHFAPSHALLREIAARIFPDRFPLADWRPQVAEPATYHALLAPLGQLDLWETEYHQILAPVAEGHPVRAFTASTAMRPYLAPLTPAEAASLVAAYDAALEQAYPPGPDGSVLFPFRRLFFTLTRPT